MSAPRTVRVLTVGLVLATAGCASLRTSVAVYKPDDCGTVTIEPCRDAETIAVSLVAATNRHAMFEQKGRDRQRDAILDRVRGAVYEKNLAAFQAADGTDPEAAARSSAARIVALVKDAWIPVDEAAQHVATARGELEAAMDGDEVNAAEIDAPTVRLLSQLAAYNGAAEGFATEVENALKVGSVAAGLTVRIAAEVHRDLTADAGIAASAAVEGEYVGYPIFDRAIAGLPRDKGHWVDFGHNRFWTFGGSAQFVVVREGHVVFRQKSLDFDPTAVIGAGAALTRLGLRLGAALATGRAVPVAVEPKGVTEGATAPTTATVVDESALAANRLLLERRRGARVEALRALADVLEEVDTAVGGTPTAAQVKELLDEFKSRLAVYQVKSARQGGTS